MGPGGRVRVRVRVRVRTAVRQGEGSDQGWSPGCDLSVVEDDVFLDEAPESAMENEPVDPIPVGDIPG